MASGTSKTGHTEEAIWYVTTTFKVDRAEAIRLLDESPSKTWGEFDAWAKVNAR